MKKPRAALVLWIVLVLVIGAPAAALAGRPDATPSAQTAPSPDARGDGASVSRAVDYLRNRQLSDGGFAEPGRSSSELLTMWTVCGLASVGQDVGTWRKSGKSPLDFLAARASKLDKLTDIEKECLAVCSAGGNPRSFGGRDLVAEIKSKIAADGHIGDLVNEHCWGIIALKAAGEAVPDGSRTWLVARQNLDGGYGYGADTGSDPDDTGAALQALIAAGEDPAGNAVKRAISYLHFCQAPDAGFTYNADQSNVGSTAWAVQGIVAAGQDPGASDWTRSGRTPLDYLAGTQQSDGHFRYMKTSDANAAWMTAEALPAVSKKAYPLKADAVPGSTTTNRTSANTSTSENAEGEAVAEDTGPGETGVDPGVSTAPGTDSADGSRSGGKSSAKNSDPRVLAQGVGPRGGTGAGGGGTNGLAVFGILCVLYLVVLGLSYVCLSYYFTTRKSAP